MRREETIRLAEKELLEARKNLENGKKNRVPKADLDALERKVQYKEAVLEAVRGVDGEPLTLEQLREMEGRPVYDWMGQQWFVVEEVFIKGKSGYAEITMSDGTVFCSDLDCDDISGRFCAHHPVNIKREAWTAEWIKCDGYTECSKCEHRYASPESEDDGDRPAFCPSCGRAMTPDAWDELEKRLRG